MIEIDFDDLTVDQQAALTDEQVQHYIRVYAMEQGVSLGSNEIISYEDEQHVPLEEEEFFTVEHENGPSKLGIVFTSRESAEKFCALDYRFVENKYLAGYHRTQEYTSQPGGRSIVTRHLPTDTEVAGKLIELEEQAAISKANKELQNKRANREREISRLSNYIWDFVRNSRAKLAELEDVRSCWSEYQDLAKDQESAVKFMLKAYDEDLIVEALGEDWDLCGKSTSSQLPV